MQHLVRQLFLFLVFCIPMAHAAERIEDLYQADVPVSGGEGIDSPVVVDALHKVLVKITGQTNVSDSAVVQEALQNASQYVREFGFHSIDIPTSREEKQRLGTDIRTQRVMRVAFLRGALLQLVKRAKLPLWSQNRPSVLVWLALDDYQQSQWITGDSVAHAGKQLQHLADERGVPLLLPRGDMEDDFALQPQELLSRDYSRVGVASARYHPDVVLSGHAVQTSAGLWIGNWRYVLDGETYSYEVLEATPEDFLALGFNSLTEKLAQKYAVLSDEHHSILTLQVQGMRDFNDYAAVDRYLNGLAAIESANLSMVDGDVNVFQVALNGSIEQLDNALALDKKLAPLANLSLTHTYDLQYLWMGGANE